MLARRRGGGLVARALGPCAVGGHVAQQVHVGTGLVQQFCLGDRVAGRFKGIRPDLVGFIQAQLKFVYTAGLAADADRTETLSRKDRSQPVGFGQGLAERLVLLVYIAFIRFDFLPGGIDLILD